MSDFDNINFSIAIPDNIVKSAAELYGFMATIGIDNIRFLFDNGIKLEARVDESECKNRQQA